MLELIREQNPRAEILLVLDKHGSHICEYTQACSLTRDRPRVPPVRISPSQLDRECLGPVEVDDVADSLSTTKRSFNELVKDVFDQVIQRVSFARKWAAKFLDFQKLSR